MSILRKLNKHIQFLSFPLRTFTLNLLFYFLDRILFLPYLHLLAFHTSIRKWRKAVFRSTPQAETNDIRRFIRLGAAFASKVETHCIYIILHCTAIYVQWWLLYYQKLLNRARKPPIYNSQNIIILLIAEKAIHPQMQFIYCNRIKTKFIY